MVFAPLLGRIPPDSGGWHRGLVSGSVAGALNFALTLDTGPTLQDESEKTYSTRVPGATACPSHQDFGLRI